MLKPRPDVPSGQKWCRHCELVKPAADFRAAPKLRDGLSSWCRSCFVARTRQWRHEHRQEINAKRRVAASGQV